MSRGRRECRSRRMLRARLRCLGFRDGLRTIGMSHGEVRCGNRRRSREMGRRGRDGLGREFVRGV